MKILFLLVAFVMVFGFGYYTGQRPEEIKQKIREFSGEVLKQTIGFDKGFSVRRDFLQAKARLIEGKSQLLDGNYKEAAKELGQAFDHLGQAQTAAGDGHAGKQVEKLMHEILEAQLLLAKGKQVSRETFNAFQEKLDSLLP
ncbi:MAG: hypothetical protein MRJ96_07000 [Nitrospirales bacterium]|nr:hypothetical protein [Nitrospira sp.]MDR4501180.1 hypothetical protein [Nitrospirales bacterium]